jgi:hypothetical protein
VDYKYYEQLYKLEKKWDLRRSNRLTERHLHPTNWEKMNVRLAAQMLSRTVAHSLAMYRTHEDYGSLFEGNAFLNEVLHGRTVIRPI